MMATGRFAFSLVELLVVIAVVALLAGLVLAAAASFGQRGQQVETESLLEQVASAVERFKGETGYYPVASGDAVDPYPDSSLFSWYPSDDRGWQDQRLFWRLGRGMADGDMAAARVAGDAAARAANPILDRSALLQIYRWNITSMTMEGSVSASDLTWWQNLIAAEVDNAFVEPFRAPACSDSEWIHPGGSGKQGADPISGLEDYQENSFGSGYVKMRGAAKTEVLRQRGVIAKADAERAHTTAGILGLADIAGRYRDDAGRILDAWGYPLGYICSDGRAVTGRAFRGSDLNVRLLPINTPAHSRLTIGDRDGSGVVDLDDLRIAPPADVQVDHNGDGSIDERDWGSLLWNALPGYERGFVLLSSGPDGVWPLVHGEGGGDDDLLQRGGQQ